MMVGRGSGRKAESTILFWIAAVALLCVNILSRFPGQMNPDSRNQYRQITTGHFNDWHPPLMARIWQALGVFGPGPAPIYLFALLAYWCAMAIFGYTLRRKGHPSFAWVFLVIGALPPFMMVNINIVKDVSMASLLLLGAALGFLGNSLDGRRRLITMGFALLALTAGALTRNNAVFAVGPLAALIGYPRVLRSPLRLIIGSMLLALFLVPTSLFINRDLLQARDGGAVKSLMLFDLAGTTHMSGNIHLLGSANKNSLSDVNSCYSVVYWDTLSEYGRCPHFIANLGIGKISQPADDAGSRAALARLRGLWVNAIEAEPLAYVEQRLLHFNSVTAFWEPRRHTDAEVVYQASKSRWDDLKIDWIRLNPLLAPGVMLALSGAVALALSRGQRKDSISDAAMAVAVSAFLYGASFLVVGVASDVRYFLYVQLAALISFTLLLVSLRDKKSGKEATSYKAFIGFVALVFLVTLMARLVLPKPPPRASPSIVMDSK